MVRAPLHFHGRIPVPEVAPLTYRDGVTHLELVYELSEYLKNILHPSLQSTVDQVVADAERLLSEANAQYVDGIQEFQRVHDAFMSDVNASLIALNDGAVSDLVKDEASRLGEVLRELFPSHEVLDTTVTAVRNEMSLLESKTNAKVSDLSDTVDGNVDELQGRLSQNSLETSFDTRSRLNTKVVDGDTPFQRLAQAVTEGEPVQFDEHAEHTGNIDGFWDTTMYGTGTITTPDGVVFTPEPYTGGNRSSTIVNNIYLDGNNGTRDGDGLTPDTAMDNLNTVYVKVLRGLSSQQAAGAKWVVHMTGSLGGGHRFYDLQDFPNELHFAGYNNCEIVATAESQKGLWLQPCPNVVRVTGVHFKGFTGTYGYGIYANWNGEITVNDCEFSDCTFGAAAIWNMSFFFNENTVHNDVKNGFMGQYSSTGQFNRNSFYGNGDSDRRAVFVTRNTICHVDDNFIQGYTVAGVLIEMASRASLNNNIFDRNTKGVVVAGVAEWANNNNTFYNNNGSAYEHHGGGHEQRMHAHNDNTGVEWRIGSTNRFHSEEIWQLSGWSYIYRGYYSGRIPAQWFEQPGKYMKVLLHGVTRSPDTRIDVGVYGDGYTSFGMIDIPIAGHFQLEAYVFARSPRDQRAHLTVTQDGEVRYEAPTSKADMSTDQSLAIRAYGKGEFITYYMQTYALG